MNAGLLPQDTENEEIIMRKLMARYLDGELSEAEATQFIEALERDEGLAAELHAHERIQAAGQSLGGERAPAGFADRLMARLHRTQHTAAPSRTRQFSWRPVWAYVRPAS